MCTESKGDTIDETREPYELQYKDYRRHCAKGQCMRRPSRVRLLDKLIGYDTAVVYWTLSTFGHQGYLYNVNSKQLTDLSQALPQPQVDWVQKSLFKLHAMSSAIFLFFCISTLVSFTLRETQSHMLRFTYLLQHHTRHELPIFALSSPMLLSPYSSFRSWWDYISS